MGSGINSPSSRDLTRRSQTLQDKTEGHKEWHRSPPLPPLPSQLPLPCPRPLPLMKIRPRPRKTHLYVPFLSCPTFTICARLLCSSSLLGLPRLSLLMVYMTWGQSGGWGYHITLGAGCRGPGGNKEGNQCRQARCANKEDRLW